MNRTVSLLCCCVFIWYFVAYQFETVNGDSGGGNIYIDSKEKLQTMDSIEAVRESIKKSKNSEIDSELRKIKNLIILNFIELPKEKTKP